MNRKNLTAAVLAGLAGVAGIASTAQAVNLNPDGIGQVLIYPYYTVNGGNDTLLSVVNTTDHAKAVKVRFMEGKNSQEVLDFNLYLSAWDVWTAEINDHGGVPTLRTYDNSCTVPNLMGEQAFLPWAMNDVGMTDQQDDYRDISDAREGHFEMIEMATITNTTAGTVGGDETTDGGSAWAATHKNGTPNDCAQLEDAWTVFDDLTNDQGYWLDNPLVDTDNPSGGLFGGAAVVNVDGGTFYSYDAKAINGFADAVAPIGQEVLHQRPGSVLPSLNSGNLKTGYVFTDDGDTESYGFSRGVDAVSYVFMHDAIMNEYVTGAGIDAKTEWVMTFPTKQFYVYDPSAGNNAPLAPFTSEWVYDDDKEVLHLPCEVVVLDTIWDREEATILPPDDPVGGEIPPIVSPAPPTPPGDDPDPLIPFELCYETNIIRFGAEGAVTETEVFGSANFINFDNETDLGFVAGWARVELDDYPWDEDESGVIEPDEAALSRLPLGNLEGLPAVGFAAMRFGNGFLGDGADVLANYGGIFQHKATRKVD